MLFLVSGALMLSIVGYSFIFDLRLLTKCIGDGSL